MRRRVVYQRSKPTESFEGSRTVLKRVRTASAAASNSLYTAYMQRIRRLHTACMPVAYRLHASCIPLACLLHTACLQIACCLQRASNTSVYTMYGNLTICDGITECDVQLAIRTRLYNSDKQNTSGRR